MELKYLGENLGEVFENVNLYNCKFTIRERQEVGLKVFMAGATKVNGKHSIIIFPEFFHLKREEKLVILYHELGHILGMAAEDDADKYAISMTSEEAYKSAVEHTRLLRKQFGLEEKVVRNVTA